MVAAERHYFLDAARVRPGSCVVRCDDLENGPGWLLHESPHAVLRAGTLSEVAPLLEEVEHASGRGCTAFGFVAYSSGSAFEPGLPAASSLELPYAWFAVYEHPPTFARELPPAESETDLHLEFEWDLEAYRTRFDAVKAALHDGIAYQVNLTSRLEICKPPNLFNLFRRVCGTQPPPFAAFIQGGDFEVASFSPELFLARRGSVLETRPMKGTRSGARVDESDMTTDPKSLAENLMIVDMVRNDLGRIADPGSVDVKDLFHVEEHRTVRQMTSKVLARSAVSLSKLFAATFPPASVTGAPKVSACQLIAKLESSPRELYCGAIGLVEPSGDFRFSVAIRTAWKPADGPNAKYGVGGGIVWDSVLEEEFEECRLKSEILTTPAPHWELIECFHRESIEDPPLLEEHWHRFKSSADLLEICLERGAFDRAVQHVAKQLASRPGEKIRLALRRTGELSWSISSSALQTERLSAVLAERPIYSGDLNLRHKTSSRQVFDRALAANASYDEVLLYNERHQIAEFCRGNAVFEIEGRRFTPPPSSGCLPGIGAKRLVESGWAKYSTLSVERARRSDQIWIVNSIRGLCPVDMVWARSESPSISDVAQMPRHVDHDGAVVS